jgi:hypothetical protein
MNSRPDVMFAEDYDGELVIARAYGFRIERCGDPITREGDLVHFETPHVHRVWRLTGECRRIGKGRAYRGVWPD